MCLKCFIPGWIEGEDMRGKTFHLSHEICKRGHSLTSFESREQAQHWRDKHAKICNDQTVLSGGPKNAA